VRRFRNRCARPRRGREVLPTPPAESLPSLTSTARIPTMSAHHRGAPRGRHATADEIARGDEPTTLRRRPCVKRTRPYRHQGRRPTRGRDRGWPRAARPSRRCRRLDSLNPALHPAFRRWTANHRPATAKSPYHRHRQPPRGSNIDCHVCGAPAPPARLDSCRLPVRSDVEPVAGRTRRQRLATEPAAQPVEVATPAATEVVLPRQRRVRVSLPIQAVIEGT